MPQANTPRPVDYQQRSIQTGTRRFTILVTITLFNTALLLGQITRPWLRDMREWLDARRAASAAASAVAAPPTPAGGAGSTPSAQATPPAQPDSIAADEQKLLTAWNPSPETLVYSEEPADIRREASDPKYAQLDLRAMLASRDPTPPVAFNWKPPVVRRFEPVVRAHRLPDRAMIFCHRLVSPAGYVRLVCIWIEPRLKCQIGANGYALMLNRQLHIKAYFPALPGARPTCMWEMTRDAYPADVAHIDVLNGQPAIQNLPSNLLRIYAGQPDPAEPARLTFRVEIGGTTGTMIGNLKDDDHVDLQGPIQSHQSSETTSPAEE